MSNPKIVDAYAVKEEKRGEFSFILVHFQLADGTTEVFEFVPPYAHALSDDLVKTVARCAPKASV